MNRGYKTFLKFAVALHFSQWHLYLLGVRYSLSFKQFMVLLTYTFIYKIKMTAFRDLE